MKRLAPFVVLALVVGCDFPEATFKLGTGSRPPKWCQPGDIQVKMNYYVRSDGREATFKCSKSSTKLTGRLRGLEPLKMPATDGQLQRPSYEVITVNGVTDIVEHREMEPYFFMTDDPAVWKSLGVSANNTLQPTSSFASLSLAAAELSR
jgi:hypothetical protein